MSYKPTYESGKWKGVCDICGRIFKNTHLKKSWDGFMVCPSDWETRHPQDFVRGVADYQAPPWTRPEAPDRFAPVCTPESMTGIAGYAGAGCAKPSKPFPTWWGLVPPGTFNPKTN